MKIFKYYEKYWDDRNQGEILPPIRSNIPKFLRKYTSYGSILNQIHPQSLVLDVGCGDGNVSSLYLSKKCRAIGVDISLKALQNASKRGIQTLQVNLNNTKLPLKNEVFDAVVLIDVLEHLIDPLELLHECYRLMKVNGKIIISVPNFARLSNRFRMLIGDPIDILHFDKYGDEVEHLHWFTVPKLKFFLEKTGYRNVRNYPTGLPFGFLFGICGLNLSRQILMVGFRR